jgi:hypothetical protein
MHVVFCIFGQLFDNNVAKHCLSYCIIDKNPFPQKTEAAVHLGEGLHSFVVVAIAIPSPILANLDSTSTNSAERSKTKREERQDLLANRG